MSGLHPIEASELHARRERVFRAAQHSWCPDDWSDDAPWLRLFRNARRFVD